MKISVIVPTYNEKELEKCLRSLSKQTFKDLEIIVVDDGSGSEKKVRDLTNLVKAKLLRQDHKGPGAARNLGASFAKGEVLVFVDADMTFEKNFIEKLVGPITNGASQGTWSREEYVSNWESPLARCWNINEGWQKGRRHPAKYPKTQKVFRAILKSEFDRVGGFDPSRGYSDDWSLSEKLDYEAEEAKGAIFYHKNPDNLREIFFQAKWIAKRRYKLGRIGTIYALTRASLPVSLLEGLVKSVIYKEIAFLIFKIVYDFGIFVGILEHLLTGKVSK